MLAIKETRLERGGVNAVKAACVHAHAARVRARDIERADPAARTKVMLRHMCPKGVGAERVMGGVQREVSGLHQQVQEAFLRADGTIARHDVAQIRPHGEAHRAAMAAAGIAALLSSLFGFSLRHGSRAKAAG